MGKNIALLIIFSKYISECHADFVNLHSEMRDVHFKHLSLNEN